MSDEPPPMDLDAPMVTPRSPPVTSPLRQIQPQQQLSQPSDHVDFDLAFHDGCYCYRDQEIPAARQNGLPVRCGGGLPCQCGGTEALPAAPSLPLIDEPNLWDALLDPLSELEPPQLTQPQPQPPASTPMRNESGKRPRGNQHMQAPPSTGCGSCACACAALHATAAAAAAAAATAAAKMRRCCGGNCRCPPGECRCPQSAVATSHGYACCSAKEMTERIARSVAAALNLNVSNGALHATVPQTTGPTGCCRAANRGVVPSPVAHQNELRTAPPPPQATCCRGGGPARTVEPAVSMPQPLMAHAVIENGMVGADSSASTQIPNGTGSAAYFRTGSEEALVGSSPIVKQDTAQSTTSARAKSFPGTSSSSGRGSKATKNGARDRTFACTLCSSTFFFKQNRDRHINEVHFGKRPHKCSHPGCKGAFKNLSGLKQHQKTVHEKARPFKCERCDRSFGQRNHLRQHILVVHDKVKMYACDVCEMTFSNVGNRTQHMKRRHADRPEAPAEERSGS